MKTMVDMLITMFLTTTSIHFFAKTIKHIFYLNQNNEFLAKTTKMHFPVKTAKMQFHAETKKITSKLQKLFFCCQNHENAFPPKHILSKMHFHQNRKNIFSPKPQKCLSRQNHKNTVLRKTTKCFSQ